MGCGNSGLRRSSQSKNNLEFHEKYTMGPKLGEGAFGVVYECYDRNAPKCQLAVKMIDKVEQEADEISREVKMLQTLNHPNIAHALDVYEEKCFVCIVMVKYAGGDLVDGLRLHLKCKGLISPDKLIPIVRQMAKACVFLHDRLIIHRDIKGDNYLMSHQDITHAQCQIALSDFGTALYIDKGQILTEKLGTRAFWSPECCLHWYSFPADIWANGIILYGLLDGTFPFKDERQIKEKVPRLPKAPPVVLDLVQKLLVKDPGLRPTAKEFLDHKWISSLEAALPPGPIEPDKLQNASSSVDLSQLKESVPETLVHRRMELLLRLDNQAKRKGKPVDNLRRAVGPDFEICGIGAGEFKVFGWANKEDVPSLVTGAKIMKGQTEVMWTPELLKQQLSGVDTSNFGRGNAKTLEDLTAECVRGECNIMQDATEHRKVVRVVDVVLLRIRDSSIENHRILVETNEIYKDGRSRETFRLPGTKSRPHESPKDTVIRIINNVMKISDQMFVFKYSSKELREEVEDSPSYPGIHTVYRKHFIEGVVRTSDGSRLSRIGLPNGEAFKSVADDTGITKSFEWKSIRQCREKEMKLSGETATNVFSGLITTVLNHSEESVRKKLEQYKLDVSKFGVGSARSIQEFAKEMCHGESYLLEDNGRVLRAVDIVLLKITDDSSGGKVLIEKAIKFPDGRQRDTMRLPGIKRRPNENVYATARRLVTSFLLMDENFLQFDHKDAEMLEETKDSPSYPGLLTVYRKHIITGSFGSQHCADSPNIKFG